MSKSEFFPFAGIVLEHSSYLGISLRSKYIFCSCVKQILTRLAHNRRMLCAAQLKPLIHFATREREGEVPGPQNIGMFSDVYCNINAYHSLLHIENCLTPLFKKAKSEVFGVLTLSKLILICKILLWLTFGFICFLF